MTTHRLLGKYPQRRAAYIMIALALAVVGLSVWNININGRVAHQEQITRLAEGQRVLEHRQAIQRKQSDCKNLIERTKLANKWIQALIDISIELPEQNLRDVLSDPTLTPTIRHKREMALDRYERARQTIRTVKIPVCDTGEKSSRP